MISLHFVLRLVYTHVVMKVGVGRDPGAVRSRMQTCRCTVKWAELGVFEVTLGIRRLIPGVTSGLWRLRLFT